MDCFLPLAQMVASRSEVFQLRFARAAAELLAASSALRWRCSAKGIELLAEEEDALAAGVARLHAVYGDALEVGEVRVRYRWEPMPLEPVMRVEVTVPSLFGPRTLNILRAREVMLASTARERDPWRLSGEGRAARVLGLRSQLDLLTNRSAVTRVTLLGYFSPPPGPGGHAA